MSRRFLSLVMIASACALLMCCRSTPLTITSTPPGALGSMRCGDRVTSVMTPASTRLGSRDKLCFLTLSKQGYQQMNVAITASLSRTDVDPFEGRPISDKDRPFLRPANGGIWPSLENQLQRPVPVKAERRRAIHLVLRPVTTSP